MGSGVAFVKAVLDEIVARAANSREEVCGLLLGAPDRVTGVIHCANVAADPARAFEIDPRKLFAAHKAARAGGSAIVGCYHSHPAGAAEPSWRDAAAAVDAGALWLIVGNGRVLAWRVVEGGAVYGRFDPLRLTIRG